MSSNFDISKGELLVMALRNEGRGFVGKVEEFSRLEQLLFGGELIKSPRDLLNVLAGVNEEKLTYEDRLVALLNAYQLDSAVAFKVDETPRYALKSFLINKLRLQEEDAVVSVSLLENLIGSL